MKSQQNWPPVDWLWQAYALSSAWYSGDEARLAEVMRAQGAAQGRFWASREQVRLHVPIAADLAQLSASLIFSASPEIRCAHEPTQARLERILQENGAYAKFLQAAELCAVHGGVFLKWNWDRSEGIPRLSVAPAPTAMPEWRGGRMTGIRFYTELERSADGVIWRLEERYLDDGRIMSRLFRGNALGLGQEAALDGREDTRRIAPEAVSGAGTLLAVYVPNLMPNRKAPQSGFGRSDFEGLYGLFDALDEAYSAIQRETRLTKTTVIVPAEYLRRRERIFPEREDADSMKWVFSNESGVFTALDIDTGENSSPITVINPEPRAQQRIALCDELVRRIFSLAGYAPQSAGLDADGRAESGTALNLRERKSLRTTEAKKTYWWHGLNALLRAGLKLDRAVFGSEADGDAELSIELVDAARPDFAQMAEILQRLQAAGAVSDWGKVELLHPDWSREQVEQEAARLAREKTAGASAH